MKNNELGDSMKTVEVAALLGINIKTLRKYYKQFGGMRIGRRFLFFERRVLDAIQKGTEMESPSEEIWDEEGENFCNQERSPGMGNRNKEKTIKRVEWNDKHNLLD